MMDSSERPHRTGSTSELFICFTSRFSSSSSMKISSKSILSPGRARDAPVSLSTSLSRRLRTNGSLKGGQSPMFPTGSKKRGFALENPEPSSPKVTCIGQVRVKTKKQGKKIRTLSKRPGGEVSFRRVEQSRQGVNPNQTHNYQANANNQYQQQQQQECLPHRNQRWVHLPLTICEALRAFGAEFSCLFPCRSSCFSTSEREKEEKATTTGSSQGNGQSSCGAVFARWLVALQDGEGGKGREIEMVVGGEEERTETRERTLSLRRHVVEEREIKDEKCEVKDVVTEEEEARVSICIPPKNALLLMRCRSDPLKMSALANRFWESPAPKDEEEEEKDDGHEDGEEDGEEGHEDVEGAELIEGDTRLTQDKEVEVFEKLVSTEAIEEKENPEPEVHSVMEAQEAELKENPEEKLEINEELPVEDEGKQEPVVPQVNLASEAEESKVSGSLTEALADTDNLENEEVALQLIQEEEEEAEEEEEERRASHHSYSSVVSAYTHSEDEQEVEVEALAEEAALEEIADEKSMEEKGTQESPLKEDEETVTQERSESEETRKGEGMESEERERENPVQVESESEVKKKQDRDSSSVLPDCLLLMMCEPKLSMEVSKETWVCSTDFIRWLPERPVNTKDGGDDPKKRISTDSNPALPPQNPAHHQLFQQPPRSSCSLPAPSAVSMATMIEQKLVNAVAYEPFVLTRCKSEPMRTAAAKLAPETCFWKNRKLEPLRRATLGLGAAGVGF